MSVGVTEEQRDQVATCAECRAGTLGSTGMRTRQVAACSRQNHRTDRIDKGSSLRD